MKRKTRKMTRAAGAIVLVTLISLTFLSDSVYAVGRRPQTLVNARAALDRGFTGANRKETANYLAAFLTDYIQMSTESYREDRIVLLSQAKASLEQVKWIAFYESEAIGEAFGRARGFQEAYELTAPRAMRTSFRNRNDIQELSRLLDRGIADNFEDWQKILERLRAQAGLNTPYYGGLDKLITTCGGGSSRKTAPQEDPVGFELFSGRTEGILDLVPDSSGGTGSGFPLPMGSPPIGGIVEREHNEELFSSEVEAQAGTIPGIKVFQPEVPVLDPSFFQIPLQLVDDTLPKVDLDTQAECNGGVWDDRDPEAVLFN